MSESIHGLQRTSSDKRGVKIIRTEQKKQQTNRLFKARMINGFEKGYRYDKNFIENYPHTFERDR